MYDTHGKQGKQSSKVIIPSNDTANPEVRMKIEGFVKRAIVRDPLGGLVISTLDRSPGQTGSVKLENQMNEPMKLELISNTIPGLDVRVEEVTPGKTAIVHARTTEPLKVERIRGVATFRTGLKKEPEYKVFISIRVMDRVEPIPRAMLLKISDKGPVRRPLHFYYYGPDASKFKLTGVDVPRDDVHVELGPTSPPQPWMLQRDPPIRGRARAMVTLPAPRELPQEGVKLVFHTSDPQCPRVEVLATWHKPDFQAIMYGEQTAGEEEEH